MSVSERIRKVRTEDDVLPPEKSLPFTLKQTKEILALGGRDLRKVEATPHTLYGIPVYRWEN